MRHYGPISGVATHKNYIATAGYDNQLILWDGADGLPISRGNHDHLVNQVSFSPDGTLVASASSDFTVRIWSVPDLHLKLVIREHDDDVEMVSFSPSGEKLATCSRDGKVRVFNINGSLLTTMTGHTNDVISVTWTEDEANILSSSDDGTIRRWDSENGAELECIELDGAQTDALVVASNGDIIAGDDNGQLILIRDSRQIRIKAHVAGVKRLIFSETYNRIASLSYDRSLIIWSLEEFGLHEICRTEFPAEVWARAAAFINGSQIVTGTFGSKYALFDITQQKWHTTGILPYHNFNAVIAFDKNIYCVGDAGIVYCDNKPIIELGSLCNFLLNTQSMLITGGQLGIIFDALSRKILYRFHSPINCATSFMREGKELIAFGTYTGEVLVLDIQPDITNYIGTYKIHDNAIKGITADSNHIFSVSASAQAAYIDINTLSVVDLIDNAHDKIANGCIKIDGGFASISRDLNLRIWKNKTAKIINSPHKYSIKCIASDTSGRYIATGSYGGFIHIFDQNSSKWVYSSRLSANGISNIYFSDDEKSFISCSYNSCTYFTPINLF